MLNTMNNSLKMKLISTSKEVSEQNYFERKNSTKSLTQIGVNFNLNKLKTVNEQTLAQAMPQSKALTTQTTGFNQPLSHKSKTLTQVSLAKIDQN